MKLRIVAALLIVLFATGTLLAQGGTGASGTIRGTVTDPTGAAVSKASVTVNQPDKAIHRTASINDAGQYLVTGLPPGVYSVTAEMAGFQTITYNNVVVTVGQQVVLDVKLPLATVKNEVSVSAEIPLVDVARSSQSDTLQQHQIDNLPINKRDYLTFTQLTPGVSDSSHLVDSNDFRVKQTPQSNISIYGSNGRGNSVTVDGGEYNDDAGGVRLNLGQDAVQEFQINRSNYAPELGSASGASINIVSRSGTNNIHMTVFGFFRNDLFDAQDPFNRNSALPVGANPLVGNNLQAIGQPNNADLSRQQYGASIGFPLVKDKTFMFVSYEGLRRDEQHATVLLTDSSIFGPGVGENAIINGLAALPGNPSVPCLTGQPALPAVTCAGILRNILSIGNGPTSSPLSRFLVNQFESNSGLFRFGQLENLGSARLDHKINDKNNLFMKFSAGRDDEEDPNLDALTAFSRGETLNFQDNTAAASWYHIFSPSRQNEVRYQFNYSRTDVTTNDAGGPGLDILGFGSFDRNIFLPNHTRMVRNEVADNYSWIVGHHAMKMGVNVLTRGDRSESHTFMAGRFVFGSLPGGVLSPCLQVPAACGLTAPPAVLNALQSANLGLPQFYQQGFGDPTVESTNPYVAGYWQDTWSIRHNLSLTYGLRYEFDGRNEPLNTYPKNFAPRASFAWDPFSNQKTVVRGGYGIFYSPVYYQIDYVVKALGLVNGNRQIAQVFVPLTGAPGNPALTSAAIFQTLFAQGRIQGCTLGNNEACITPANLAQFGINVTNSGPVPPLTVLFSGDPNFRDPYTQQFDLGVDHQFMDNLGVSVSYIHALTLHLPQARDVNLLPTTPISTGFDIFGHQIKFQNWRAPQCSATPTLCFANPLLLQNNEYLSAAAANYDGGLLEIKYRPTRNLNVMVNYTYSKAIDNATDYNSDFSPFNAVSLQGERNVSPFDQRHKLVATAVWETPWKGGSDMAHHLFGNWTVAPIFRYNSGHPFNVLAGTDINGDRHSTNDRPLGISRDSGLGPDFFTWDLRLAKRINLGERVNFQLTAEAFNLLNRTNPQSLNNVCTPATQVVGSPQCGTVGSNPAIVSGAADALTFEANDAFGPSEPGRFTSANDKRQIQFGVRFSF